MKIFQLKKNILDIQKCFLPVCNFLKENYGKYCILNADNRQYIVKIGLFEIKSVDNAIFLDDSVLKFSSFNEMNRTQIVNAVYYENFIVLGNPLVINSLKVVIVFNNVSDVKKFKEKGTCLETVVRDILKFFVVTDHCVVFLNNFSKLQSFNMYCLIISIEKPGKVFRVTSETEIYIQKCISKLKFEQLQEHESTFQLGGVSRTHEILKETVELSKYFNDPKLKLVKKLLLIGPAGCGKTTLVHNVAKDCNCVLLELIATNIISLTPSATEIKLKDIFNEAKVHVESKECCIILIEDIDLMVVGKSSHSKHFVRQLIRFLEEVESVPGIVVIATTNSPNDVDVQLRLPKRLEDEIEISIPTSEEREDILQKIFQHCKLQYDDNLIHQLAKWTPGFVGADLKLVVFEALMAAIKINGHDVTSNIDLTQHYFKDALKKIIPSSLRGTVELSTTKNTSFSQIGGLDEIKQVLDLSVKQQLYKPQKFTKLGIPLTKGILLYGPPGCAKTTLVKALAKESNATFLATNAAELYSPFVGDSEKKLVQLFSQARISSPSILFIDEIDAVVGNKSRSRERGVQERILSTLLVEMDGVGLKVNTQTENFLQLMGGDKKNSFKEMNNGVIVIGATNRPQLLDDALKRPGRFDRLLYVPPPNESERLRILQKLTEKVSSHESVDLLSIAKATNFFSGADLKNLCQESGLFALKSSAMTAEFIHQTHFEHILKEYRPSLNKNLINFYENFQKYNT